jgi:hypothetical protein
MVVMVMNVIPIVHAKAWITKLKNFSASMLTSKGRGRQEASLGLRLPSTISKLIAKISFQSHFPKLVILLTSVMQAYLFGVCFPIVAALTRSG